MAKPVKRKTVVGYLRSASDRMERSLRAAAKCKDISQPERNKIMEQYRHTILLEEWISQRKKT